MRAPWSAAGEQHSNNYGSRLTACLLVAHFLIANIVSTLAADAFGCSGCLLGTQHHTAA
jgi:hypothetical protein